MSDPSVETSPPSLPPGVATIPVSVDDGSRFDLLHAQPDVAWHRLLYWVPAMGMPARHYLALVEALARRSRMRLGLSRTDRARPCRRHGRGT